MRVPAQDLVGEAQASHGFGACGELHATDWHMEYVRSARGVEHIDSIEEARERLTVSAVADEPEAGGRGHI